jgi:hypothetical protein
MRKIVHKLRNRSREARERMLFGITAATFLAMLGVWMIILDARARETQAIKEVKQTDSPFSILGDGIKDAVDTVTSKNNE